MFNKMKIRKTIVQEIIIVSLLVFFTNFLFSQKVSVSLLVPQPYPTTVEGVLQFKGQSVATLTNISSTPQKVKLLSNLKGNNGVSAFMDLNYTPSTIISLNPGETRVLTGNMLKAHFANLTESNVRYSGVSKSTLIQTEKLPEGSYELCIRAYDYNTSEALSPEFTGCSSLLVSYYDPPIITMPIDKTDVNAKMPQFLNFIWTPSGLPQYTRYRFEIVDMSLNNLLNPNEAFDNISIFVHYKKENITQSSLPYDISLPKLTVGRKYAVRVTAYDPTNNISFKNNGKSAVISFTYKSQDIIIVTPPNDPKPVDPGNFDIKNNQGVQYSMSQCNENINIADNKPINGQGIINNYDIITIGKHQLKVTSTNWNGNLLSGQGKIINSWLKVPILVEFQNLKVNAAKVVIDGTAIARNDDNVPTDWINDLGNVSFGGPQIKALISKLMGNNQRVMTWPYENMDSLGLGMPIGINRNIGGSSQMVAIVGMHFGPKGAGLNAVAEINMPSYGQKLSLGASGVCIDEKGFTKDAFLYLIQDYTLNPNGKFKLKLNAGNLNDPAKGCYITMEKQGFKNLQLEGGFIIDATVAKPIDKNKSTVDAPFKITVENPKNFILDNVSVTPFELVKLPGFQVTVSNISIDHSETQNPSGIIFPTQNYNNEGNLWQGFYFKNITIKLPEKLHPNHTINALHFLVDKKGFSGIIDIPAVFDKDKGQMGAKKWKFSMKDFYVKIIENQFQEGRFKGDIRVPITKQDVYMKYIANLSLGNSNKLLYNMSLTNQNDIEFPAIIAKGKIQPDTEILIKDDGNGIEPEFHLYGELEFNRKFSANVQGVPFKLDKVTVQDLVVDKNGVGLGPDGAFSYSYDSEQRTFNGFDISMDTFYFSKSNEMYLGFSLDLLGENNAVGATTGFSINTTYDNNNMILGNVKLKKLGIDGDISVAKLNGEIEIMENDPKYGNGFSGKLKIDIKLGQNGESIGGAGVDIKFGNMPAQNNTDAYKYFFFAAELSIGLGIPLSASLRLYGLKGGMYYNMIKESPYEDPLPFKSGNDTKFGILAGVDIGLIDKAAFHAKPQFMVQFGTKSGLDMIAIFGDAYAFTQWKAGFDPYPPGTSPIHISMMAKMDFKKKIFDFDSGITIQFPVNKPLVTAGGTIKMHIAGAKNWYIKIGEPGPGANIGVKLSFLPIEKKHYFMAGYGLPGMPAVPQQISSKLGKTYHADRDGIDGENNPDLRFALGSYFDFSTGDLTAWILYANFAALAGYDVAMSKGWGSCGINSWYLEGQAYALLSAEVGVKTKIFKKERKFKIAAVSAALLAEAALPNPTQIKAHVAGEATFLGIIKGKFTFAVNFGKKCEVKPPGKDTDALEDLKYVQDIKPVGNGVHVFTDPEVSLLFSANDDKVYELEEYENDEIIKRKFMFPLKSLKMVVDDANSNINGKVLASWGINNMDGFWEKNASGDRFVYKSFNALPPNTNIKIIAEVMVKEQVGQNWQTVDAQGTKKEISFKTGSDPDHIVQSNIEVQYPAYGQRYYLQGDAFKKGYIKLKKDQQSIFQNKFTDKFMVRFIPVGGGTPVDGKFEGYSNNTINFTHPDLVKNKMYVLQLIKETLPIKDNSQPQQPLQTNLNLSAGEFKQNLTKEQKLIGDLKLSAKAKELYKYPFGTSIYNTLSEKLNKMNNGIAFKTMFYNDGYSMIKVNYESTQEGFDKADVAQLTPQWYLGQNIGGPAISPNDKGKPYRNDYLKKVIYDPYNDIIVPKAYPNAPKIAIDYNMSITNAEPILSESEIKNILLQPANPGLNNIKMAPGSKKISFFVNGASKAHDHFNDLKAKLLNPDTHQKAIELKIKNNDSALFNYIMSVIDNPAPLQKFKTIDTGNYYLLMHRNAGYHHRKVWML